MNCIRCQKEIFPNDNYCDICEMVGCGCQFQPATDFYIDGDGPYCEDCVTELEEEL